MWGASGPFSPAVAVFVMVVVVSWSLLVILWGAVPHVVVRHFG